jgi:hypothetical protein
MMAEDRQGLYEPIYVCVVYIFLMRPLHLVLQPVAQHPVQLLEEDRETITGRAGFIMAEDRQGL